VRVVRAHGYCVRPGDSGEPIVTPRGELAGLVVQARGSLAHAVPARLLRAFADGREAWGYLPGLSVQPLTSAAARRAARVPEGVCGVRVVRAHGYCVRPGDVVVCVGGYALRGDGCVDWDGLVADFRCVVSLCEPGSSVNVRVFRPGVGFVEVLERVGSAGDGSFVEMWGDGRVVRMGEYVFAALSEEYLKMWGARGDWEIECPQGLLRVAREERGPGCDILDVVVLAAVLEAKDGMDGVGEMLHGRVVRVAGRRVSRLEDLVGEEEGEGEVVVEFENGFLLCLPWGRLEVAGFEAEVPEEAEVG